MSRFLLLTTCCVLSSFSAQSQTAPAGSGGGGTAPAPAAGTARASGVFSPNPSAGAGVINNPSAGSGILRATPSGGASVLSPGGGANAGVFSGVTTGTAQGGTTTPTTTGGSSVLSQDGQSVLTASGAAGIRARALTPNLAASAARLVFEAQNPLEQQRQQAEAQRTLQENLRTAIFSGGTNQIVLSRSASPITVISQNGSVTLTGTVADEQQRARLESDVRALADVSTINNQLQVAGTSTRLAQNTLNGSVIVEPSGSVTFSQVLGEAVSLGGTTPIFSAENNSVITVVSGNGIVALFGEVANLSQRSVIETQVRNISGVREVQNNLVVSQ